MENQDLVAELNEDNQLMSKEKKDLRYTAEEWKKIASEKATEFGDRAKVQLESTKKDLDVFQASAEDYVKKNPVASVAIAAGVGFVLGLLSGRK